MSDELRWGPLYAKCGHCNRVAQMVVDKDFHPHLDGKIGVRCPLCQKGSAYPFGATPEEEIERQRKARELFNQEGTTEHVFGPEEWPLFQAVMFGLMPQPSEPADYTPDADTLFRWRLLRAESVGLANRVEEAHAND